MIGGFMFCNTDRIMGSFKKSYLVVLHIALSIFALLGATESAQAAESPAEAVKHAHEHRLKNELEELKSYLSEAHQGKRDDDERYVILHRMLQDYGLLHSTGTPEAQTAIQEWHQILSTHPEYTTHPPRLEIREQRKTRERQEKAAVEAQTKATSWTPKDDDGPVYGLGNKAVIVFLYRAEFFHLPDDLRIETRGDLQRIAAAAASKKIKPIKTMTFQHIIDTGYLSPEPFDHAIWLCANLAARYTPRDADEMALIGTGRKWRNAVGELEDFCGAVSLDGNVVYKLPISQSYPNKLLRVLQVTKDGKKAAIGIGKSITEDQDGIEVVGIYQEVLIWEFPDKLETIDVSDRAKAKAILEEHGLSPWVLGR